MKISNSPLQLFAKAVVLFIVFSFISGGLSANDLGNKTYIWITIDTESSDSWPLIEQVNPVFDGVSCGISRMMDICDRYRVKATFFFSVCEFKAYGEEKIEKIAQYIHSRGHDVQLHPHPDWAYDQNRPALWQYSLQDQIKIIADGKNLIYKWTGISPIAHRAGGYMADNNTIKALAQNGFLIDSSFFYKNKLSRISFPELEVNSIKKIDRIWEIPVTLYMRNEVPANNLLGLEPVIRYRKIDIDWADYDDLKSAIHQAQRNDVQVVTLFLHSFIFGDAKEKKPVMKDIERFEQILTFISDHPKIEVVTSNELVDILKHVENKGYYKDFVPSISSNISYLKFIKRKYLFTKTRLLLTAGLLFSLIFIFTIFFFLRSKKTRKA